MKSYWLAALLTCTGVPVLSQDRTCDTDRDIVLAKAASMADAFKRSDAAGLVDMMYPPMLDSVGGRGRAIAATAQMLSQLAGLGATIEKSTLGTPTATYRSGSKSLCFIPQELHLSLKDTKAVTLGYLIAVRDDDASAEWTFLEARGFDKDPSLFRLLFPGLPAEVQLPKSELRRVP
jgi:hypothetical protein